MNDSVTDTKHARRKTVTALDGRGMLFLTCINHRLINSGSVCLLTDQLFDIYSHNHRAVPQSQICTVFSFDYSTFPTGLVSSSPNLSGGHGSHHNKHWVSNRIVQEVTHCQDATTENPRVADRRTSRQIPIHNFITNITRAITIIGCE
jgi:hypothetical protein